jgi:hypothetical protein
MEPVSQRRARSNMDEGAAGAARASNVRVANELCASAATRGPDDRAGRKAPNAAPPVNPGRSSSAKPSLMQRQPWVAGSEPARNLTALDEKDLRTFNTMPMLAASTRQGQRQPATAPQRMPDDE